MIKINCVIGVDPGSGGGIAVYSPGYKTQAFRMPKEVAELNAFFEFFKQNFKPIVFLEKLSVRPDDIVVQDDKAAMGKLYRVQRMMANFEQLKTVIEVSGIPYVMVHPLSWQAKLKLRKRGQKEEKADRKRRYKEQAATLYPEVKTTLWNADAILLMHFGRWALANDLKWVKSNLPKGEHGKVFDRT